MQRRGVVCILLFSTAPLYTLDNTRLSRFPRMTRYEAGEEVSRTQIASSLRIP